MATLFSPSAALLPPAAAATSSSSPTTPKVLIKPQHSPSLHARPFPSALTAAAAAAVILSSAVPPPPVALADPTTFTLYYGTAASAASYGGYGGNASKKDTAEYTYEVPNGWKERLVSKVEKGTNGTDSEFYNPRKRAEREYLTFLAGFPSLAPVDVVLNNLALSDVDLQDLIASADAVRSEERRTDTGQLYYVYEIEGAGGHSLISVTCARNKLYAHFVNAPKPEWDRDEEVLRHVHGSFKTV
ncbi:hypothetical protein Taro_023850 [Colocasia esculenta]|uniref:PsbP C-terminal domain-containing protein n=1 Tax=Colocasia esculenta TaxID=4460 RepID=A0A843VC03_COLES|nr:hypothetical protein [Colocasia esculenta]